MTGATTTEPVETGRPGARAAMEPLAVGSSCHGSVGPTAGPGEVVAAVTVALVGAPNVGKSSLFNRLTGAYVTVSNYPGTSVGVDRGRWDLGAVAAEVIDTPGMYSLLPTTEEERVARRIVLAGEADVLVQVVDAKSLERGIPLTLQLLEVGRPVVVAVNMMDAAESLGLAVDHGRLSSRLGVPVVPVVAVRGRGLDLLAAAVRSAARGAAPRRPEYE
ncbi:MAG: FeoB small GTPase domain-containing protein, partial [Gemmatimonadota bacterium]